MQYKIIISFSIIITLIFGNLKAQIIPPDPDTIKIVESFNDSIDLASHFYNVYDSLSIYFYPASDKYDNWNTDEITYQKLDSSMNHADSLFNMDTSLIVLQHDNSVEYVHPFCGLVTSRFGGRRSRFHYGIDVDLVTGDTVRCAFDGMVRINQYHRGYGNIVVVRHNNGLETVYAHLSQPLVDTSQFIKAGDIIGLGGNTGRSTGSHLHFEVRYLGAAINPEALIDFKECKLKRDTLFLNKKNFGYLVELRALKDAKYHTVKSGNTLGHIARVYGTSVSALCRMNGIRPTTILQIGQKLRVR
ncbi:MAG: peptidoglycan DD-metalloendopeptidase family protein [Saprospiraceae bacterium]|nr:peptidoglycan DD-metalloendopeptidase family protein [Saprospiraceae bacterium]